MTVFSWVVWLVWVVFGVGFEVFAVFTEKKQGTLPLTRVVRDRLMRRSAVVKVGVLLFLTWLWVHFTLPLDW